MLFVIYGFQAEERELGNAGMKGDEQKENPPAEEIYRTHDSDEANGILQNGGFLRNDKWFVAARIDTVKDEDEEAYDVDRPASAVNKNDVKE